MTSSDNILKEFIHLGKSEKEVLVLGFKIKYRTLTTDEQTAVFDHCARYGDFARVSALRRETLIYAIETINGARLEELYQEKDKEDISDIEMRRKIFGKMDTEAINVFFAEHAKMSEERNKILDSLSKADNKTEEDQQVEEEVKNSSTENPVD